jgi:UrcA family protein
MSISLFSRRIALAGLSVFGVAAGTVSAPAHAQPGYDYAVGQQGGDITVYAPRRMERDRMTGAPIEVATVTRTVYYGDLDLSAPWGVRTLHARVVRAAVNACDELDSRPDLIPADSEDCVQPAVRDAMDQAPIGDGMRYRYSAYTNPY